MSYKWGFSLIILLTYPIKTLIYDREETGVGGDE